MEDTLESPTSRVFSLWYHEFMHGIRGMVPKMSVLENSALKDKILNPEETEMSDGKVLNVTFQLEVLGVIQGLQHQVVNLTSTVDTLVATVKTLSNNARDLSTNVVASAAKTTPQVGILQRPQTRSYAEAAAQLPKTPAKGRKRSAIQEHTPPKNPKQKKKKEARAPEDTSAIPAKGNNENATVSHLKTPRSPQDVSTPHGQRQHHDPKLRNLNLK